MDVHPPDECHASQLLVQNFFLDFRNIDNLLGIPRMLSIFSLFEKRFCKDTHEPARTLVPEMLPNKRAKHYE